MPIKTNTGAATPQQAKLAAEFLRTGNVEAAKAAAGYSPKTNTAFQRPAVQAILDEARKEIVAQGKYNLQMAMDEADEAIEFSRATENANAYVKALELKSKLNGLLIEKHQHQIASFSLNIRGVREKPEERAVEHELTPEEEIAIASTTTRVEEEDDEDLFS